ncbi:MAG TPA: gluconate 2-dehydrogenase subunit 3 family protein [Bacteroidota bacterium]|nr:gluconate 2-dehydrogenase subunit 3 family protein [Bacteroidota bacterium]
MDDSSKYSRREFLTIAALGAGSLTLAGSGLSMLEGCASPGGTDRNFLTDPEYRLMEAIAEQIIPTDEWPGGRDAGVANFIDIQLAGPYKRFQSVYRKGLKAIEDSCVQSHGGKFEDLSWDTQTNFLQDMEAGRLSGDVWANGFAPRFFELLRSHSLQGYYGSPRHGGNKNFVSYRMMGLDEIQTVGQNRYGA